MIGLWFVMGAAAGSAANALIDRLPKSESWCRGRSKCDACGHSLGFLDLIPVASFLILGGKCRYCKKPIRIRNLVVEAAMGMVFAFVGGAYPVGAAALILGMFWTSAVIAVVDWETRLVSEMMVIAWGVLAMVEKIMTAAVPDGVVGGVVGVAVIGGIWALSRGRAMGFGDVEIAAVMGLILGWERVLAALWMAFVTGAAAGLVKMGLKRASLKSEIAFGPFLILGTWLAYFWGEQMVSFFAGH